MRFLLSLVLVISLAGSASSQTIRLNEILSNPPGSDAGNEYFELFGTPNLDFRSFVGSGESLWFLVVDADGDGGGDGVVEYGIDLTTPATLSERSLGSNGLFLFRDGITVFNPAPASGTNVRTETQPDTIDNEANLYLLVRSFTGTVGATDLDPDNDGDLDSTPWAQVYDAVTVFTDGTGFNYGASLGGALLSGPNFPPDSFTPDLAFRVQDTGQWAGADLLGSVPGPLTIDPMEFFFEGSTGLNDPSVLTSQAWSPGNFNPSIVPEPTTLLLGGLGLGGVLLGARRARKGKKLIKTKK